jgi:hypothetical protein
MWYNDDDYNQPVSPHPMRGGRARRTRMLKLWSLEEIRQMMGANEPIEGCLIVEVNMQKMQVAFTTEQPPAEWKSFEYAGEYDPRSCIPLFAQPVYGVFLGSVQGGIPLAILSTARGASFGVASFRGGEHKFNLIINDPAATTFFREKGIVRLGDRLVVTFPYDSQKVARAKSLGGKFFGELKAWVFPAELEKDVEVLLK